MLSNGFKTFLFWSVVIVGFSIFTFSMYRKLTKKLEFTDVQIVQPIINVGSINQDSIIEPDCHCTMAEIDSSFSKDENEIYIKAAFDNKITGVFQRTIKVFLNTKDSPKILTLRGRVRPRNQTVEKQNHFNTP
jgi:Protein of unknown function (DUF1573)